MIRLRQFNALDVASAAALLRPLLNVDRWVDEVVAARPYRSTGELFSAARTAAHPFSAAELEAALAHHPRIGEQPRGDNAEAKLSRSEQAGLSIDDQVKKQLAEQNQVYEQRFGRVFLIRASGRSSTEILDKLQARLNNDPDTEDEIIADELRQITLLRLAGLVSA